jgi:hypothetical protein
MRSGNVARRILRYRTFGEPEIYRITPRTYALEWQHPCPSLTADHFPGIRFFADPV